MAKETSEYLSDFLNFVRETITSYPYIQEEMTRQVKIEEDCHHIRELYKLSDKQRRKLDKTEKQCLADRRACKNVLEKTQPIVDFFSEETSVAFIKRLEQILGDVRRVEKYHRTRAYTPKVLNIADILGEDEENQ